LATNWNAEAAALAHAALAERWPALLKLDAYGWVPYPDRYEIRCEPGSPAATA